MADKVSSAIREPVRFSVVGPRNGPESIRIFFEPEGAEVPLPEGETFTVEISGGREDDSQLELN